MNAVMPTGRMPPARDAAKVASGIYPVIVVRRPLTWLSTTSRRLVSRAVVGGAVVSGAVVSGAVVSGAVVSGAWSAGPWSAGPWSAGPGASRPPRLALQPLGPGDVGVAEIQGERRLPPSASACAGRPARLGDPYLRHPSPS